MKKIEEKNQYDKRKLSAENEYYLIAIFGSLILVIGAIFLGITFVASFLLLITLYQSRKIMNLTKEIIDLKIINEERDEKNGSN